MKKYIYTSLLLLGTLGLNAQTKETAKADTYFDNLEYVNAISEYLEVIEDGKGNDYVYGRLADTYYNVFNTTDAEKWYKKVVVTGNNPEQFFKYAQILKANGKYDKANTWMDKFSSLAPNDVRAVAHKNNPNIVAKLLGDSPKFKVTPITEFNSKYSEFGPVLFKNQVYYSSARSGKSRSYGWNEEPYLDIYVSDYDAETGALTNESKLGGKVNTKYNEGTVNFSPDGKTMYFSGESYERTGSLFSKKFKKDTEGKSTINLYSATMVNGQWSDVKGLPFNSENHNTGGPAVSTDGKRLYFNSDMKGTIGGSDLWYVTINGDGTYGDPVNLGNKINTEGSEMFPFISSKGILYFTSNGHPGLGMMDIFAAKMKGDDFGSVRNAGAPINSGNDDFSFTIDEESQKGFFASNRSGGAGSDDIYAFEQIIPVCDVTLTVQVVDSKTKAILPMTAVVIYDENNNKITNKTTDENGNVQFKYECNQAFKVEANRELYLNNSIAIAKTDNKEVSEQLPLDIIIVDNKVMLNPIFFELDKHNITAQGATELDKLVAIMNKYPEMIISAESHTDSRGKDSYNLALSDRRAKSTAQHVISKGIDASRITGKGKGETQLINECANGVKCSEEAHQANRRSEFIIVKK
ncbi:MAG: cell envelope biogenesis protein OmpA [Kordia sp.]|nr:MAG: cell envelope biogenesis protein OmpA [Kordia sp.]